MIDFDKLLKVVVEQGASDLFITAGLPPSIKVSGKMVSFYHTSNELTQSGVMGNPSAASPEKGELILGKLVEQVSETVKEFRKLPIPKGV